MDDACKKLKSAFEARGRSARWHQLEEDTGLLPRQLSRHLRHLIEDELADRVKRGLYHLLTEEEREERAAREVRAFLKAKRRIARLSRN